MRLKNAVSVTFLFLASAALPLAALTPRTAMSTVRTFTRWGSCETDNGGWYCSAVAGSDFLDTTLSVAYFDYGIFSGTPVTTTLILKKESYTGTISQDSTTSAPHTAGIYEDSVNAVATKANPSQWDYLFAEFRGPSTMNPIGFILQN